MYSAHVTCCTLNCNLLNGKCYCLNYSAFTNTKYVLPKIIFVYSLFKSVNSFFSVIKLLGNYFLDSFISLFDIKMPKQHNRHIH